MKLIKKDLYLVFMTLLKYLLDIINISNFLYNSQRSQYVVF